MWIRTNHTGRPIWSPAWSPIKNAIDLESEGLLGVVLRLAVADDPNGVEEVLQVITEEDQRTALHHAAAHIETKRRPLPPPEHHQDPSVGHRQRQLPSAASSPSSPPILSIILRGWHEGVRCVDGKGDTPLHVAAAVGNVPAMVLLHAVWPGAALKRNHEQRTPLEEARTANQVEAIACMKALTARGAGAAV